MVTVYPDLHKVHPPVDSKDGPTQGAFTEAHWKPRPLTAFAVALALRGTPLVGSVAAGLSAARVLPRPSGVGWVIWVVSVVAASQLALAAGERVTRRLLPISTMLRYSLAFPDRAPSRFGAALRSGNVERMRRDVEETSTRGLPEDLQQALETALAMVAALNKHDRGTRGHSDRVRAFSEMLAEEMGLDRTFRERLRWGALLHDMGKLTVPAEILNKNAKPTNEEWAVLQGHPAEGERMLAPLAGWLGDAVHAAGQHHERWDGKGYPNGLTGHEISISARIVAVADAFAVMTAARAYKKPVPMELARQELTKNSGTQFDPVVVRAMLSVSVGKVSRTAGFLAPLANVPFLGSIIAGAPSVPAMVSSGAAAIVVTASLAVPASPLQWANPIPFAQPPVKAALKHDVGTSVRTKAVPEGKGKRLPTRPDLLAFLPRPEVRDENLDRAVSQVMSAMMFTAGPFSATNRENQLEQPGIPSPESERPETPVFSPAHMSATYRAPAAATAPESPAVESPIPTSTTAAASAPSAPSATTTSPTTTSATTAHVVTTSTSTPVEGEPTSSAPAPTAVTTAPTSPPTTPTSPPATSPPTTPASQSDPSPGPTPTGAGPGNGNGNAYGVGNGNAYGLNK